LIETELQNNPSKINENVDPDILQDEIDTMKKILLNGQTRDAITKLLETWIDRLNLTDDPDYQKHCIN
jgi:hypothetical protein